VVELKYKLVGGRGFLVREGEVEWCLHFGPVAATFPVFFVSSCVGLKIASRLLNRWFSGIENEKDVSKVFCGTGDCCA
jgi:hypothetical protein